MSVRAAINYAVKRSGLTFDDAAADSLRREAYATAAKLGLLGVGAGVAVRSSQGLLGLADKKKKKVIDAHAPVPVEVPVRLKASTTNADMVVPDLWPRSAISFDGRGATRPSDIAWYYPLLAASALGGAYAGHKGTDMLLDRRRAKSVDSDLERAKKKYEQSLQASARTKLSSAMEKLAISAGEALGLYLAAAGGLGAGAASYGYSNAQSRSKRKVMEDAAKARKMQLRGARPPVMYAVPKPITEPESD